MNLDELLRMARRAEEDGKGREWYPVMTRDRRQIDAMHREADRARD